jgi:hypothetical protein
MTDPTDASQDLVLYGLDDKAKPRAGLVAAADGDAALALAAGLNFQLLPILDRSAARPRSRAFAGVSRGKRLLGRASGRTRSFRGHRKSVARTGKLGA